MTVPAKSLFLPLWVIYLKFWHWCLEMKTLESLCLKWNLHLQSSGWVTKTKYHSLYVKKWCIRGGSRAWRHWRQRMFLIWSVTHFWQSQPAFWKLRRFTGGAQAPGDAQAVRGRWPKLFFSTNMIFLGLLICWEMGGCVLVEYCPSLQLGNQGYKKMPWGQRVIAAANTVSQTPDTAHGKR